MLYAIYYEQHAGDVLTDVDGHGAGGDALAMLYAIYYEPLSMLAVFLQM